MKNQSNLLKDDINRIKSKFGFKNYPLLEVLQTLESRYHAFDKNIDYLQNMRPASIKKKLKKILKYLSKANDLLNDETQPLFPFFTIEQDFTFKFINNYLPEFLLLTDIEIRSIKDKGGRPKNSLDGFLILHLLTIYNHGTKQPIKCYWNASDEVAIGKTFDFISMVRSFLPQISTMLKISSDDQFICQVVKKFISRFPDLSKIPSFVDGTET